MQVTGLEDKYYKMVKCFPLSYFILSINVYHVNSFMRIRVGLCNFVLSQKFQNERLLGYSVLFICLQFCFVCFFVYIYIAIEVRLDCELLSIEDQGLLFIQPRSYRYI